MKMTRFEHLIVRVGCNKCDSPKIAWKDREDKNHLCYECMQSENDRIFERGDQN